jgi:hypothetical protein
MYLQHHRGCGKEKLGLKKKKKLETTFWWRESFYIKQIFVAN